MDILNTASLSIFPLLVAYAGVSDLLTMKIGNRISALLILCFVGLALFHGFPPGQWGYHLAGSAVVFVPCLFFFARGWMGGGDAKIASSIALWLGLGPELLQFLIFATLYGALLTLVILKLRQIPVLPGFIGRQDWILRLHDRKSGIPYGISIAIAALQIYPETHWMAFLS